MPGWTKICCAIDLSDASRLAVTQASELARLMRAELKLLHVVGPPPATAVDFAGVEMPGGGVAEQAEAALAAWKAHAERLSPWRVDAKLRAGEVIAEILRFLREQGIELLVLGSDSRTQLKTLGPGSVAARLARQASCPVLIARPRDLSESAEAGQELPGAGHGQQPAGGEQRQSRPGVEPGEVTEAELSGEELTQYRAV
jgi:universal stress protein A